MNIALKKKAYCEQPDRFRIWFKTIEKKGDGASFSDKLHSEVKQNRSNLRFVSALNVNFFKYFRFDLRELTSVCYEKVVL